MLSVQLFSSKSILVWLKFEQKLYALNNLNQELTTELIPGLVDIPHSKLTCWPTAANCVSGLDIFGGPRTVTLITLWLVPTCYHK